VNRTNLWPYLRQRRAEVAARREAYSLSFLAKFFHGLEPISISARLWTSPDNEKQVVLALRYLRFSFTHNFITMTRGSHRFVLTRLWFLLSIGGHDSPSLSRCSVTDVQEVIKDEICVIAVRSSDGQMQSFYVLEATCEVIGHPIPPARITSGSVLPDTPLRADWSAYIAAGSDMRLIDRLRWTNHEEYERGISKLWLKRVEKEGELGRAKRKVAERYVLACVVGNG
jgi:hypothetical protein